MSEKALLDWFGRRRGHEAVRLAQEHVLKVMDTTAEMDNALGAMVAGDRDGVLSSLRRVELNEKAADSVETAMFEALTTGEIASKDREDLMRLVRRVDHVADWIKVAARNLQIIIESGTEIPPDVWTHYKEMSKNTLDCARALKETVDAFGKDADAVRRHRHRVEQLERLIDDLYFDVKKNLVSATAEPGAVILLNDLLEGIENAADYCKGSADMLYILVMAGR